ncbi:hypothetical protein ACFVUS_10830 [Nocardia sp. NPDC058058]|uniref:hypothetical protein n=1 Tax=Nocardia sp. NPDC058058 TaxID=3346317 RepID=UPI0036DB60B6
MSTVISEFDTIGSDFGFDSIPWELRGSRAPERVDAVARQAAADRRPCRARVLPVSREHARAGRPHVVTRRPAGPARGIHPLNRVQRAQIGFAAIALTALMTAMAVVGLIALAQLRAGEFGSQTVSVVDVAPAPAH